MPVGEAAKKFPGLMAMNEVAADIWAILPEKESADEIAEALLPLYEVSEAELKNDTEEFLSELREMGVLE